MKRIFITLIHIGLLLAIPVSFAFGYIASERSINYSLKNSSAEITPVIKREISKEKLWNEVNDWRREQGLSEYVENDSLCRYASIRLYQIQKENNHNYFLKEVRSYFPSGEISENLANDFDNESEILESWLNSPSHRENLKKNYIYSCIATDGHYVVHLFMNP